MRSDDCGDPITHSEVAGRDAGLFTHYGQVGLSVKTEIRPCNSHAYFWI